MNLDKKDLQQAEKQKHMPIELRPEKEFTKTKQKVCLLKLDQKRPSKTLKQKTHAY